MRVRVGRVEEFPLGQFRPVDAGGRQVHVLRSTDGHFYAIRDSCPHRGAAVCPGRLGGTMLPAAPGDLVYGLAGRVLQCPQHHWEFDLATGQTVAAFTKKRLVTYAVDVTGDQDVYVEVPALRAPEATS